jgi:thioredoxin reductase
MKALLHFMKISEIVIVGSGPGGAVTAALLSEAKKNITLILDLCYPLISLGGITVG